MKKIFLVAFSAAIFVACKKNSSGPTEMLLSKVIVNGQIDAEYIYNSDKQIVEERTYTYQGAPVLNYIYKYTYDAAGNLKEMNYYKQPENKLAGKYVYTLDGMGRIMRNAIYSESGADSGQLATYIDNEYDAAGLVSKQSWRQEDETLTSYRSMGYYPNGNLRTAETFFVNNGVASKAWGSSYAPSDTTLPASFYQVKAYPINFYYAYLVSAELRHWVYENGQVSDERKEIITAREFNARGLVKQQTVTMKHIKPVAADEVRVEQYEYVTF